MNDLRKIFKHEHTHLHTQTHKRMLGDVDANKIAALTRCSTAAASAAVDDAALIAGNFVEYYGRGLINDRPRLRSVTA